MKFLKNYFHLILIGKKMYALPSTGKISIMLDKEIISPLYFSLFLLILKLISQSEVIWLSGGFDSIMNVSYF